MRRYLAALCCLALCSCPGDLRALLREYGYTPVRPASSLWKPGSFVYVIKRNPLQVGFVCTASQVMGPDYAPLQSMTNNADIARATKKGLTLGVNVQDLASVDGEFDDVRSVSLVIRNAREFVVTDLDVAMAASRMNRRCLSAIARRRAQGYDVTFLSAAIEGDVSYQINYRRSSKLDAQAKIATAQNLSVKLGVDATSVSDKTIQANALIWGVRADEFLARVLAPEILPPADRGSKIFDPNAISGIEACAEGTEPRSMPATPLNEIPVMWAPLPGLPPAPTLSPNEIAASAAGDGNLVAPVTPPQPLGVAVDVVDNPNAPADAQNANAPANNPNGELPAEMTQEQYEALLDAHGPDWNDDDA